VVGIGAGGGVASGLGLDDAVGAPRPGPLEFHGSVGGFPVDDQHAAKDETEGVGDDGGAAGGDAALGEEDDEVAESRVDFLGRLKGRDGFPEKLNGEVGNVGDGVSSFAYTVGVSEAEAGGGILNGEAAATVGTVAAATAGGATRGTFGSSGVCGKPQSISAAQGCVGFAGVGSPIFSCFRLRACSRRPR